MNDNDPSRSEKYVEALRGDFRELNIQMTTGLQQALQSIGVPKEERRAVATYMAEVTEYAGQIEAAVTEYVRTPGPATPSFEMPDFEPEKG